MEFQIIIHGFDYLRRICPIGYYSEVDVPAIFTLDSISFRIVKYDYEKN